MFKKMLRDGAGRIALFTFALLAPCVQNTLFGQAFNVDGQSVADVASAPPDRFPAPATADVYVAQNEIANPTHNNDPIGKKTTPSGSGAVDSLGPVPTKKASVANLAPYLLPYFNNGPVFGLPGTDSTDFG